MNKVAPKTNKHIKMLNRLVEASKELAFKGSYDPLTWSDIDLEFNTAYSDLFDYMEGKNE